MTIEYGITSNLTCLQERDQDRAELSELRTNMRNVRDRITTGTITDLPHVASLLTYLLGDEEDQP
jgi:hypothetical protein